MKISYKDIIIPQNKIETRTADQIIGGIKTKLNAIGNE